MALEHALLVALSEQPASGLDLARRFGRSIGFFWSATHQQIYRVLGRMDADGWVTATEVAQTGRPDKKVYAVSAGRAEGAGGLARRAHRDPGAPQRARGQAPRARRSPTTGRPSSTSSAPTWPTTPPGSSTSAGCASATTPSPATLSGLELDQYLVLRGGIRLEEFWVDWLTEYLEAHDGDPMTDYPHLLSPITLGPLELRNRVVMGSMHTGPRGPGAGHPEAGGVLRRAGPRGRRPDRDRRLRARTSAAGSSRSPRR